MMKLWKNVDHNENSIGMAHIFISCSHSPMETLQEVDAMECSWPVKGIFYNFEYMFGESLKVIVRKSNSWERGS